MVSAVWPDGVPEVDQEHFVRCSGLGCAQWASQLVVAFHQVSFGSRRPRAKRVFFGDELIPKVFTRIPSRECLSQEGHRKGLLHGRAQRQSMGRPCKLSSMKKSHV